MSPLLLLLHLLPFFFFTAIPAAAQSINQYGTNCPSYMCGDVNISYPFWKTGSETTNQFCGYQGFGIDCNDRNIPLISFGSDSYYVKSINSNYNYRSIVLIDYDVSSVAPGPHDCPRVRHNITLGILPLQFLESMVNISFHFNCTGHPSIATPIPCLIRDGGNAYVNVMNDTTEEEWADYSCADKVVTTVFPETDLIPNLDIYGSLLQKGFEMQWEPMDDCERCEDSGGRCGYLNTTRFLCFCPNGTTNNKHCKGFFQMGGLGFKSLPQQKMGLEGSEVFPVGFPPGVVVVAHERFR